MKTEQVFFSSAFISARLVRCAAAIFFRAAAESVRFQPNRNLELSAVAGCRFPSTVASKIAAFGRTISFHSESAPP